MDFSISFFFSGVRLGYSSINQRNNSQFLINAFGTQNTSNDMNSSLISLNYNSLNNHRQIGVFGGEVIPVYSYVENGLGSFMSINDQILQLKPVE